MSRSRTAVQRHRTGPEHAQHGNRSKPRKGSRELAPDGREGTRRRLRWRLRHWRLMPRFGAVLLVPVVTIGLLTWLRLDDEIASVTALSTIHEEQQLADQAEDVATALQSERDAIVSYIAGGRTTRMPPRTPSKLLSPLRTT